MKRCLFIGPSLPDAADLLVRKNITVLPPVAAGDLLKLAPRPGDVVGIVDGYFHHTRTVRHKEILAVLDAGVAVLGAASIGALRAAELDTFGMQGVGAIYRDYREGRLTADDEVALMHAPAEGGYRPISEPLVNIRATLDLAEREGILDSPTSRRLIEALAQRPYRLRSYRAVVQMAQDIGLPVNTIDSLRQLCSSRPVNLKREDSLHLVDALRSQPSPRRSPGFNLARTVFLHKWELAARGLHTDDGWVGELSILRMCQLFAPDYPEFHRDLVFSYLARECALTCDREPPAEPAVAAVAHAVHRGVIPTLRLDSLDDFRFLDLWLTPAERRWQDPPTQLATFVVRSFQTAPVISADAIALDALRERPVMKAVGELVCAARSANEEAQRVRSDFDIHALSSDRVLAYFMDRWNADASALELHALDRGIESLEVLVASARPYYLLAKYNPALMNLRMTPLDELAAPGVDSPG